MAEDIFAQKGWICPKCGRVLAPSMMYCLWCCSDMKETITTTTPTTQTETQNSNLAFEKRTMRDCYNCKRYENDCECIECHYEPKTEPTISKMEQVEDDAYFLELMGAVERGEISDAGANQAWYEYINHKDEPQTEPLPKTINGVRIADAVAWADKWLEDNPVSEMWDMIRTLRDATEWQDEPHTERSDEK